jgi:beta-1,2-mannosidase
MSKEGAMARRSGWALALLFFGAWFASAQADRWPFGALQRVHDGPVLSPQGDAWESAGTFNPSVVNHNGTFVMLYRAQDRSGTSRLGYASSSDGVHFTRRPDPVLSPEAEYERNGGVEDPRLVKIGDTYFLTYTAYNKKDAQLALATSTDLEHWDRKGVILPAYKGTWNVGWTKAGAILPERIDGKYWMYYLGTAADKTDQMGLASSVDLIHWTDALDAPVLPRRPGRFDSRVVEPGPAPLLTGDGIVLIYNGADDGLVYRTGIARFDRRDPRRLLSARTRQFSRRNGNGRRPGRSRMSSSWKGWSARAIAGCSTTAVPTNTWASPKRQRDRFDAFSGSPAA